MIPDVGSTYFPTCPLPKIDENNTFDSKNPKERVIELLDILESHVEKLRKEASQLEEDRDQLLSSIDSVRNTDVIAELEESRCIKICVVLF